MQEKAMSTSICVNGVGHDVQADGNRTLLDILRNELSLTGTHFGCGEGLCGACMVLVDGRPVFACDTPLWSVENKRVTTVEGLAELPVGSRLQQEFITQGAAQCGYCTSGMLVSATALLTRDPEPSEQTIRQEMDRNLCRCGVQLRVIKAIRKVASDVAEERLS
jgi:nicotinate dehydrogenase subunit A